jgi:hypothetical protein
LVERAGGASRQNGAALAHLAARRKDDLARRRWQQLAKRVHGGMASRRWRWL